MAKKGRQSGGGTDWSTERTLADVEEERETAGNLDAAGLHCACGSNEFLLEAYLHVVNGEMRPEPVEVETLTCPSCSREFEAIRGEGGRILRGDFLGYADLEDDEDW